MSGERRCHEWPDTVLKNILSVGSWTLVSRITGFGRDIALAGILGAGPLMDVFTVANRLPNHFRAIFGEGAFNSAFVPAYARVLEMQGLAPARVFSGRVAALLALALGILSLVVIAFMPSIIGWLAPGFVGDTERFDLAVTLTRITFPYLFFICLVTLVSGVLNAHRRFAAAAAAPVLLNLSILAALALAFLFPTAAHAAAWGVTVAGALELLLVLIAVRRVEAMPAASAPRLDVDVRAFLKALAPASIGAAGVQLALFADTILVTLLPTGAPSSLYYADRLYQLPVGVIGIAAGTVLLPQMSRLIAADDPAGAHAAQNRSIGFTLALAAPFTAAFLLLPDLIMTALFARGAFGADDAAASGAVLAAYTIGLPAVVLIRSAVASFFSRADTTTPVIASLTGVAINVALKLWLMPRYGAPGLALATALGAWINLGILYAIALRRGWAAPDALLGRTALATLIALLVLVTVTILAEPLALAFASTLPALRSEAALAILGVTGSLIYGAVLLAGFRLLRVPLRRL